MFVLKYPKARLYVEGLPAFTRRTVVLPDHPRLLRELRLLERRGHVGGKDSLGRATMITPIGSWAGPPLL